MSTHVTTEAITTNVNTAGQHIVIQTTTARYGPFASRAEAEAFAAKINGDAR